MSLLNPVCSRTSSLSAGLPRSTQVYHWPRHLVRLNRVSFIACLALFLCGATVLFWPTVRTHEALVSGVLLEVFGSMGLISLGLLHITVAREVRFTRDAMIVRQAFHRDLILPYSTYDLEWMADSTAGGNARVIVFEPHRGCTVLRPPVWFATALAEIARIQEEEGWYEPRLDRFSSRTEPFASSQS